MDERTNKIPGSIRRLRNNSGYLATMDSVFTGRDKETPRRAEKISSDVGAVYRDNGGGKGLSLNQMIKNLQELFEKEKEKAMQRRAEESRLEKAKREFDDLDDRVKELLEKKKKNG